jgi:serine/threonine-protein kinase
VADVSTIAFVLDEWSAATSGTGSGVAASASLQSQVDAAVAKTRREVIRRRVLPTAAAVLLTATIAGAVGWRLRPIAAPPPVARFTLTIPGGQQFTVGTRHIVAISSDGTQLAYVASNRLYLRSLSEFEAHAIPGTDIGDVSVHSPAFSPDGRSLAFFAATDSTVKRIAVGGGAVVTVCPAENPIGITWDSSGIIFGQNFKGILRCPDTGGTPEQLATVKDGEVVSSPEMLPGGDAVLFTVANPADGAEWWDKAQVVVQSLTSGKRKTLIKGGSDARYLRSGHLLYALGGIMFAVPFDLARQEVTGGRAPVVEGVKRGPLNGNSGIAQLATSTTGALLYLPGPIGTNTAGRSLALADRAGVVTRLAIPAGPYVHVRASHDGTRLAVGSDDGKEASVSIYRLGSTGALQRLTIKGQNRFPIWSGDGERVAFQSDREGDLAIFSQRADGTGPVERLTKPEQGESHVPESWSPDGKHVSFSVVKGPTFSLWMLSVDDKKTTPYGGVQSREPIESVFSPDGRWIAYDSSAAPGNQSPNRGVYVQPFPATGAIYQLPRQRLDFHPVWSSSGRELIYVPSSASGQLAAVSVTTQPSVTFGSPAVR